MCANSAPPIKTKFSSPATLPYALLEDNRAIVDAHGQVPKDVPWLHAVVAETEELFLVHKDFQVGGRGSYLPSWWWSTCAWLLYTPNHVVFPGGGGHEIFRGGLR
mmetsp:Transcript_27056/g.40824  ORF Transcript_27056/g.40824 Transcript_27056/m.40824 type:complete len:105 (-) Transcript_27056:271-585(-)